MLTRRSTFIHSFSSHFWPYSVADPTSEIFWNLFDHYYLNIMLTFVALLCFLMLSSAFHVGCQEKGCCNPPTFFQSDRHEIRKCVLWLFDWCHSKSNILADVARSARIYRGNLLWLTRHCHSVLGREGVRVVSAIGHTSRRNMWNWTS
jgi:hypothetical protein